ncbi:Rrf2 family transcriptional regulator [Paenibacillus monticola]|uniref:Rrf2 family transcriptional regulator n=1 Tax=Paenibacillus monticola TaxID=2666075 RepID=A0A7X2H0X6_9BACL|nr:Rrf2 family transcriptional regulator [Paenibacillus monticola]
MSVANRGIDFGPPHFKIAIHAIVGLATSGGILSSAMIASKVDSHATFLRRILQALASAGIVESKGGREGGYMLNKPPAELTLGDIYNAVAIVGREPLEEVCCGEAGEQLDLELEKILWETEQHTIQYLHQFTIAYVMSLVNIS